MHWLASSAPFMMKMDVAPVSTMAQLVAIVIVLILCDAPAVVLHMVGFAAVAGAMLREQLEAIIVIPSLVGADEILLVWMGFGRG